MTHPTHITFFERFEADILAKKKTITIRDESESHYVPNSVVTVATFEDGRVFGKLKIENVTPIHFDGLNERHAQQENMTLPQLKQVIRDIYPDINELYVLEFCVVE